ncbi:MAG TPA: hypothetical protein VJG83_06890 [archaeon]|nr:hypothetical protein [archaeon]
MPKKITHKTPNRSQAKIAMARSALPQHNNTIPQLSKATVTKQRVSMFAGHTEIKPTHPNYKKFFPARSRP